MEPGSIPGVVPSHDRILFLYVHDRVSTQDTRPGRIVHHFYKKNDTGLQHRFTPVSERISYWVSDGVPVLFTRKDCDRLMRSTRYFSQRLYDCSDRKFILFIQKCPDCRYSGINKNSQGFLVTTTRRIQQETLKSY